MVNINGNARVVTLFYKFVRVEKPQLSFNCRVLILSDNCGLARMSTFFIVFTYIIHATCGEEAAESERDTCQIK